MPNLPMSPYVLPILMLIGSNVFMTTAWYGHLRFKEVPLAGVIVAELGDRLRRILPGGAGQSLGQRGLFTAQLKTMQEVITLARIRCVFDVYLRRVRSPGTMRSDSR